MRGIKGKKMTKKEKTEPPPKKAFDGRQLDLFRDFLCNTIQERETLSNTIELWDAIPKFQVSKRRQSNLRKDGLLPTFRYEFSHRKKELTLRIRPARLTETQIIKDVEIEKDVEYYPSAREELVEDALRKIASESRQLFLDKNRSGVTFTIHMLRKELARQGHTLSFREVRDSLFILTGATIELLDLKGRVVVVTNVLSNLIQVNQTDLKEDPNAKWYADFSVLVTEGIKNIDYRQFNYFKMMHHKSQLARWFNKKLSHNYLQASLTNPYKITFSTIKKNSGLLASKHDVDNRKQMIKVLKELKDDKILFLFEVKEDKGQRGKVLEVKYTLFPHQEFIAQVKAANRRSADAKSKLTSK